MDDLLKTLKTAVDTEKGTASALIDAEIITHLMNQGDVGSVLALIAHHSNVNLITVGLLTLLYDAEEKTLSEVIRLATLLGGGSFTHPIGAALMRTHAFQNAVVVRHQITRSLMQLPTTAFKEGDHGGDGKRCVMCSFRDYTEKLREKEEDPQLQRVRVLPGASDY